MGLQLAVHPVEAGLLTRAHTNLCDKKRESVESKQTTTKSKHSRNTV